MALKLVSQREPPAGKKGMHTKHYLNPIECCPRHVFHSLRNDETAPACPRCGCSHDNLPRHLREVCDFREELRQIAIRERAEARGVVYHGGWFTANREAS